MNTNMNFMSQLSLFTVILLDVMGMVLILPVLTPLILQTDSSLLPTTTPLLLRDFIYGLSLGLFPIFMFFSMPILGDLSDKFGRKKVLLVCLIGSAISYAISCIGIFYNSIVVLLASRAIAGLAAGTQPIASAAIIDVSHANEKMRNLGRIVLVSSAGIIIGPLLGGFTTEKNLSDWFGYETPFFIAAILSFLNAVFLFYTFQETHVVTSQHVIKPLKGFILFLSAFLEKKFRVLSFSFFCFILAWSLYFQSVSWFFMQNYHYNASQLGLFIGFIGVVFAFATLFVAKLAIQFIADEKKIFLLSILGMAIANIGCALTESELSQWLWVILNGTGNVICYTVSLSLFSNSANDKSQGWMMGVAGAIGAITWGIGAIIAGPLGFIDIHLPLWTAGILCLISFLLMLSYRST